MLQPPLPDRLSQLIVSVGLRQREWDMTRGEAATEEGRRPRADGNDEREESRRKEGKEEDSHLWKSKRRMARSALGRE
jgi:hypothetical protein